MSGYLYAFNRTWKSFGFKDGDVVSKGGVAEICDQFQKIVTKLEAELSATKEKLESAEKRIRESQEQEPEGYIFIVWNGHQRVEVMGIDYREQHDKVYGWEEIRGKYPLYTMPPIPPELAELQRENAELRKQLEAGIAQNKELWNLNAELQKKIESLNDLQH